MNLTEAAGLLKAVPWGDDLLQVLGGIRKDGGLPLIVGGAVRDVLLGRGHKDVDVEVHGMTPEQLVASLAGQGLEVDSVGASFGVVKVKGMGVDFSLPRSDSKSGPGHKGFDVMVNPHMGIEEASRRRDLTINSMMWDPVTERLHDYWNGLTDLKHGFLSPVDPKLFLDDPLRALRVAQFLSRLDGFKPCGLLKSLCAEARLEELPGERLFVEFQKMLSGNKPSRGLEFMRKTNMLCPELEALVGCEQDPTWHPEGSVWVHTLMAVDAARELSKEPDMTVMWATLCHDLGKPSTTRREDGRIRARGHEVAGVEPTISFLGRMKAPGALVEAVCALVSSHLAPATFHGKQPAGPGAYRRLALKMSKAGTSLETLFKVSQADHFGRTTPDAIARSFHDGDCFLAKARVLKVDQFPEGDVVLGRHLIERGLRPGPEFKEILLRCREIQYEKGLSVASEIMRLADVKELANE